MFQVSIFNNNIEISIHEPSADKEAPHILTMPFKESLSKAEELSFLIPIGNPGYNLINALKTRVKITDTRDNKVIFSGRVIPFKSSMTNAGEFLKEVTCEGAMNYLNDTNTRRWNFTNKSPEQILSYILQQHNAKVDISKQISIGLIEVTQPITIDTNHESTLNAIITKIRNILGGDIRVRETNNILYLDYLIAQGSNNNVEVKLGYNLKDMMVEYDPLDMVNRAVMLGYGEGINQLGIESVNSGLEYIEDSISVAEYGVIECVITNKDLQNASTLKAYGQTVLNEKKQIKLAYIISQLDLSVLVGHNNEKFELGDTLHSLCSVMEIDVYDRVVERERDLILSPWNPLLTISTRPITLSDQIIDLKLRNQTLENAPQGSTCIFPYPKDGNIDATHPMNFDLDIPKETININKVYLNLHGRKYRADSKAIVGGGGSTATSSDGGGYTNTYTSQVLDWYQDGGGWKAPSQSMNYNFANLNLSTMLYVVVPAIDNNLPGGKQSSSFLDLWEMDHRHKVAISIPTHGHSVVIPIHGHDISFGIYESTYPNNVRIKINGIDFGVNYGDGTNEINQMDLDITPFVNIGNNKIEISTTQNGRIEAIIYSQIFIQSK